MDYGRRNIRFGWIWVLFGIISGMILGMFVFNGPIQLSNEMMTYTSLPRRMLRLAHISFFGLGFLNMFYSITMKSLNIKVDRLTSRLLIFGSVTIALFLIISAFYEPFKYSLVIPALSLFVAAIILTKDLFSR